MALPEIVSREDWLEARQRLLALEKEQTARITALNAERRRMPMVRIEKKYVFDGPDGPVTLAELFGDRSQLIVQHVMFQPEWDAACPGCTASIDVIPERLLDQVHSRDTAFVRFPGPRWPSSRRTRPPAAGWCRGIPRPAATSTMTSTSPWTSPGDRWSTTTATCRTSSRTRGGGCAGLSCFLRDGDEIFHTYSTYARGAEQTISAYALLDMTAFGRSEDWEEPKGRARALHGADPTFTD